MTQATVRRRSFHALHRAAWAGAAATPLLFGAAAGLGASATWLNSTGDTDANWSTESNWDAAPVPGSIDLAVTNFDNATFGSVSAGGLETPVLDASRRINNLNIDNSGDDYNIAGSGVTLAMNGFLTVTGGGMTTISPAVNLAASVSRWDTGTTSLTLANGIRMSAGRTLTLANSGLVTVLGSVVNSGSAGLTLHGNGNMLISGNISAGASGNHLESIQTYTGTLTLAGTNNIGGNIVWRAGVLEIASASATGGAGATLSAGSTTGGARNATIVMTGAYTVSRNLLINNTAISPTITFGGTHTSGVATFAGNFNLNGATVAALNLTAAAGGTVDFTGVISSSATNMNKVGLGTVRFTNANTYGGRTSVAAGTLLITNSTGSGTGSAVVQVGPAGTFGGSGISNSSITVGAGGKLRAGNGDLAGESLTLGGNLTLADGSIIQLVLGNGSAHSTLARTGGTWTFDGDQAFALIGAGTVTAGQTYDNIITNLAADPGVTNWQIITPQWAGVFSYDGANVDFTTTAAPEPASLSLLALGGVAILRRRRIRAS